MFERYTRDRERYGAAVRGAFYVDRSVRRSFIFIAAGTAEEPDCREPRLREFVFVVAAPAGLRTLKTAPPFRIMSSFVSPLLEKETGYIPPRSRLEGNFLPPFLSLASSALANVLPLFEHSAINRSRLSQTMFKCSVPGAWRSGQMLLFSSLLHCCTVPHT